MALISCVDNWVILDINLISIPSSILRAVIKAARHIMMRLKVHKTPHAFFQFPA